MQSFVDGINKHDLLIVVECHTAKVGRNKEGCESVMCVHGIGVRNDNGDRLVIVCSINNLVVTGTIFPYRQMHTHIWILHEEELNQIYHVLVSRQPMTSIRNRRVTRGAEIASVHHLVRTKLHVKLKRKQQIKISEEKVWYNEPPTTYSTRAEVTIKLRNIFDVLWDNDESEESVENKWQYTLRMLTKRLQRKFLGFSWREEEYKG